MSTDKPTQPGSGEVKRYVGRITELEPCPVQCVVLASDFDRLQSELAAAKAYADLSNYPIKYYQQGGVIYAVHGTSSINYVERLLTEIADLAAENARLREALDKGATT